LEEVVQKFDYVQQKFNFRRENSNLTFVFGAKIQYCTKIGDFFNLLGSSVLVWTLVGSISVSDGLRTLGWTWFP